MKAIHSNHLSMKNLFLTAFGVVLLASCTTDSTCTCSFDDIAGVQLDDIVTECLGCDKDETEAFEEACVALDALYSGTGQCVLN